MTRSILARLIALLVITVAGVYYIAFDAVGLRLTDQPYTVKVDMPEPGGAGGIYTDAYVTYRGVEVGKVSALDLQPDQVVAVLSIHHGVRLPANVTAHVKELTAAAEQYMDLVPAGADPPGAYLAAGAVIPGSRVSVPVSVGTLLNTVNSLVSSLNPADLNTLTAALATGLQDAGGDLHAIIADGNTLVQALQSAIPGTAQLISAGHTDLQTFAATNNDFQEFSTYLDELSAQLEASNAALQGDLESGAAAGPALDNFLGRTATATEALINSLSASTGVAYQRQDAVRALFQVLPLFASDVSQTVDGGQIHFQVDFNLSDPVCAYTPMLPEPTQKISTTANLNGNCATSAPGMLQRGADTAPPPRS